MSRDQARVFFTRYRDAFNAGDGDAVAALWHVPSSIADTRSGAARVTCWTDETVMRANMLALSGVYRGVADHAWAFELLEHIPLGAKHAFSHVSWVMTRGENALQRFSTGYQLGQFDKGWQVLFCTAYQEDPSETKNHAAP